MVIADGKLRARRLGFTLASDGDLLVLAGLAPTEEVLLAPPASARDGDPAPATAVEAQGAPR
jgi:hypothetical protein